MWYDGCKMRKMRDKRGMEKASPQQHSSVESSGKLNPIHDDDSSFK